MQCINLSNTWLFSGEYEEFALLQKTDAMAINVVLVL